jgi:hypothetical protein
MASPTQNDSGVSSGDISNPAIESLLINTSIRPMWSSIRAIRVAVQTALAQYDDELAEAAIMVSSELLENALKYGEEVEAAPVIQFYLGLIDAAIVVRVANGSTDTEAVEDLKRHVRLVNQSDDKGALYQARLEELLMCSCTSSKLGIYRIAHEGRFDIDCSYHKDVVTVTATRSLS